MRAPEAGKEPRRSLRSALDTAAVLRAFLNSRYTAYLLLVFGAGFLSQGVKTTPAPPALEHSACPGP